MPVSDDALAHYPGLRGYGGRPVVVGIRADDLHVARTRPDLPTLTARLDLVEALGAQSIAYFKTEAEAIRPGVDVTDEEAPEEGAEGVTASRPNLVASFPPLEAASLRLDDHLPVAVDTSSLHFFDEATGAPLR